MKAAGFLLWCQLGMAEQPIGQRLQSRLDGDLPLGAAFGFVGQVEIFQPGLGVGGQQIGAQGGRQVALLLDGVEDDGAPLLEFAQVAEPLLQVAQLGVVEAAGHLFAITGDEGNRGPFIQQADGGFDLCGFGVEFGGDDVTDGWHLDSLEGNRRAWRRAWFRRAGWPTA